MREGVRLKVTEIGEEEERRGALPAALAPRPRAGRPRFGRSQGQPHTIKKPPHSQHMWSEAASAASGLASGERDCYIAVVNEVILR